VSFATITLCIASQRVFVVVVYFIINSVQKLLHAHSYMFIYTEQSSKKQISTIVLISH